MTRLETPCREWQGPTLTGGYGYRYAIDGKGVRRNLLVHRWIVAQIDGWPAIDGKVVMHKCDNVLCFRYDHLQIGTQRDNNLDSVAKGRNPQANKTHCPRGHEYDHLNTSTGGRECKACRRLNTNRRRATKRAALRAEAAGL